VLLVLHIGGESLEPIDACGQRNIVLHAPPYWALHMDIALRSY
jgi:hypothetical protein